MVEFCIVALPLLFVGFAAIESARWMLVRQAVGYALLEAGRAGSVAGASPVAVRAAFERALAPLHVRAGAPLRADGAAAAVREAARRFRLRYGLPLARLEILSPDARSFDDFADPWLAAELGAGRRVINQAYQAEQNAQRGGPGPRSGGTIHDANTLLLRATYLQAPVLPGLRALVRQLPAPAGDAYLAAARSGPGLLAIVRTIAVAMQSHPQEYPGQNAPIMLGAPE
ncbi:TadE/TadG family type IV pilus assembly protein [Pigmentiphaga soli]|uniref:TadE/TadG family type IV pilus assembly protein n=1 Tax=Pigmentiphaga soli TaxID=1007095 RepID=UPI0031E581CB